MTDTPTRTRRAASYADAIAWIVANTNEDNESLFASFVSDVFKRDRSQVDADVAKEINKTSTTISSSSVSAEASVSASV